MNTNWQKDFFNRPIVTEFWNKCTPPEQTRVEADFLEKMLDARTRLLDVACGNGRHALELARRGCRVTGLDISEVFLRQATAAAQAEKLPAEFLLCDMRELRQPPEFNGAYCFGNAFGYFPHADMVVFLNRLAAALLPGGRLVVDAASAAESLLPRLPGREWFELDDILFIEDHRYLAEESCLETEAIFLRDGRSERLTWWHWIYTAAEIRRMLEGAGFKVTRCFGSLDEKPFTPGTPLLVVAEKES